MIKMGPRMKWSHILSIAILGNIGVVSATAGDVALAPMYDSGQFKKSTEPFEIKQCTEKMLDEKNRDDEKPKYPIKEDYRLKPSNIVAAHQVLRAALQDFLEFRETNLGNYLSHIIETDPVFIDEYGNEIRSYYKVFSFIWVQYNETLCQNYAITKFDKDKLDLCSVARFLSHKQQVRDRRTLMKRMGIALGYKCHPCTPYKGKEYGVPVVPDTEDIDPEGVSPEESLVLCRKMNSNQVQGVLPTSAAPTTTFTTTELTTTTTELTTTSTTTEPTTTSTTTELTTTTKELTTTPTTTTEPITFTTTESTNIYTTIEPTTEAPNTTISTTTVPTTFNINYPGVDWMLHFQGTLWKGAIVPYTITDEFSPEELQIINDGMQQIQNTSCIQFIPRTLEDDYINIINGGGCSSTIGRLKGGQDLSLQAKCLILRTVTNILMFALGFPPEHNRPDRDEYIDIDQNNLKEGALETHFQKYDPLRYPFNSFYDYDIHSIMHYGPFTWAKDKRVPSIRSKKGNEAVGPIDGQLSPTDGLKLKKIYNC